MELARMTSKGQLTIPVSIRRKIGLDTGDQVLFYEKDGRMIIAASTPDSLKDAQVASAENHVYSVNEIRKIVAPIAEKYGIRSVRLFGSYARGEARSYSDLDFVINEGETRSLFQLGGLQAELAEAFHKKVDLLTESSLEPDFRHSIQADEVMIYDRQSEG